MTTISVAPFLMKDVLFQVDADNYEAACSQVEFTPTTSTVTWKGLTPTSSFTESTQPTWVCNVSYAQDWTTVGSLSQYLLDHAGETVDATFKPIGGLTGPSFAATVTIVPGPIGGTVDTVAVATVALGVIGSPTFTPATP